MKSVKKIIGFVAAAGAITMAVGMGVSAYNMATPDDGNVPPATNTAVVVAADRATVNPDLSIEQALRSLPTRRSNETAPYVRSDWADRWGDRDNDCLNTRAEALAEESRTNVSLSPRNPCRVASGHWVTPWTRTSVRDAAKLQIDHHVPVADAHRSGGHRWSPARRQTFYNDMTNLNALPTSVNQDKSAHTPDRWRPQDRSAWCGYATQWVRVKGKYRLSVTGAERRSLDRMLDSCQ